MASAVREVIEKEGDILDVTEGIIVQQCNCVCIRPHGLSKAIADKWPWADPYSGRKQMGKRNMAAFESWDTPGTWMGHGSFATDCKLTVVDLFAQLDFGVAMDHPKYEKPPAWRQNRYRLCAAKFKNQPDTMANRLGWFYKALDRLCMSLLKETDTVYFPYKIGCGLAGGHWPDYHTVIKALQQTCPAQFVILRKPENNNNNNGANHAEDVCRVPPCDNARRELYLGDEAQ
jgi:hypothetical protein